MTMAFRITLAMAAVIGLMGHPARGDEPGKKLNVLLFVVFAGYGRAFSKSNDQDRREFHRAYLACTSFMEAQVGRVLDELDRRNLWDNTVVILLGDHGYHLGEREWWNKNTLFDRSCRAPMIIAAPGVEPGVATGLVEFVDLLPTVADLCGMAPPEGIAGESLRPMLEDPSHPGKRAAYTIVTRREGHRGDSIRTERWRFTQWSDGARELYDHVNDPEETVNLAAKPDHAAIVRQLSEHLRRHRTSIRRG